jgi:glycosyltransferase involved in cell wall biosynthesis
MSPPFRLSIAIPLHNEESVLPELLRRTRAVLDQIPGGPHEIVFVDDGSADGTFELLEQAVRQDPRIRAISLSRNFGHQAALTAALDHLTGDAAVVMDGDLQDTPEAIPQFVERHHQGFDVVYAQRIRRKEPWPLRLCYFVFYRMMATLSDVRLPLDSGDFGLMSRRVLKLAADGIFAFSIVPIRAAALLGAAAIGVSTLYVFYAIYYRLFLQRSPQGFTALVAAITFLSGVLLFFLGVIGEYVGRIYEETKARPIYVVERLAGNFKSSGTEKSAEAGRSG